MIEQNLHSLGKYISDIVPIINNIKQAIGTTFISIYLGVSVYFKVDIIAFYEETNGRISNSIVILILPISKCSLT